MNAADLTTASIALLRSAVGWQTAIARRLDIQPRTVRRWIATDQTPDWVDGWFSNVTGLNDIVAWPRDEWMCGLSFAMRRYVAHLQAPRFVGRVVFCDPDGQPIPEDQPADVHSGTVYVIDGSDSGGDVLFCEIDWIDQPHPSEIVKWLEAASDIFNAWEDMQA